MIMKVRIVLKKDNEQNREIDRQTRWGIHEVQTRNKAIKYQRDLVSRAMEHVVKMDESGITDLMIEIEAEYERKYGENVARKYTKTVL